jgi:hypothetical protein
MDTKRITAAAILWLIASTLLFGAVTSPALALEDTDDSGQQQCWPRISMAKQCDRAYHRFFGWRDGLF